MMDLRKPVLADNPSEWDEIPSDILHYLTPRNGMYTPIQMALLNKIAANRWFLIRNELGARAKYSRRVEPYLTTLGIERPFNGLNELILFLSQYDPAIRAKLLSGMKAGTIVPISKERAYRNIRRIREKGLLIYPDVRI